MFLGKFIPPSNDTIRPSFSDLLTARVHAGCYHLQPDIFGRSFWHIAEVGDIASATASTNPP